MAEPRSSKAVIKDADMSVVDVVSVVVVGVVVTISMTAVISVADGR